MVKSLTPRYCRKFCHYILTKKVNFEQKIMFQLHPATHRQDDYILAPFYPDKEHVCMVQGAKKIMY